MRINYLETLIKVFESGSITETAKELFISQPAVTKQIKALEKYYEVIIFNREGNRLTPTAEGEVLYRFASKVVNYDHSIKDSFCETDFEVNGELEIVASNLPSYQFIPSILSDYLKEFPNVRPHIETMTSDEVIDYVDRSVVAFGFTGLKKEIEDIEYYKLFEEGMVLVGNASYKDVTVSIERLQREKFAVRESGSASLRSFEEYLEAYDVELTKENTLFICSDNEMLKRTILQNDILTYLPKCSIEEEIDSGKLFILDTGELRDFYYMFNPNTHMCNRRRSFHQFVMEHYIK